MSFWMQFQNTKFEVIQKRQICKLGVSHDTAAEQSLLFLIKRYILIDL